MRIILSCLIVLCISCFLQNCEEEEYTVAKGKITNNITGEPVVGLSVSVYRCQGGWMAPTKCDHLISEETDINGEYSISFLNDDKQYSYRLELPNEKLYYSDKYYASLKRGEVNNNIDFSAIPYNTLSVHLIVDKDLHESFQMSYMATSGTWFSGTILNEWTGKWHHMDTTLYCRIVPLRDYDISTIACDVIDDNHFVDCESLGHFYFSTDSEDTTRIDVVIQ